jgi:hypothetical protein
MYDPRLGEPEIKEYCAIKEYKERCPCRRRFLEETDSLIVKRDI